MTVLYFAHARQITGVSSESIPLSGPASVAEVWELIACRHPNLGPLRTSSRLARDNDFLAADATIAPEDEIAVIPPVSGG